MPEKTVAITLFSGGLDSILTAKILEQQGIKVICVHFTSPFFGDGASIATWRGLYNLEIIQRDIGESFTRMLRDGPARGFGKALNPCIACKALQIGEAAKLMREYGADILATGEVLGQRPMSQRRDALDVIANMSPVEVLRPLSARLLRPTKAEEAGLVDRNSLLDISGRGRDRQLALAGEFNLARIPTPAGGCLLTEKENARRFWPLLKKCWRDKPADNELAPLVEDFHLATLGRQRRKGGYWLCIGRNKTDNALLLNAKKAGDAILKARDFPGPVALARGGCGWPREILREACAIVAGHTPRAARAGGETEVFSPDIADTFKVAPVAEAPQWDLPSWEETREEIKEAQKAMRR